MTDLHELLPFAAAAILVFASGAMLAWLVLRGRVARAFSSGGASREGELASLAEQRDSARSRIAELGADLQRHESGAQVAERSLREAIARAAAADARLEQLQSELTEARGTRDDAQARLIHLTGEHASLRAGAEEKERSAAEKLKLIGDAEMRLRESFQNLAHRILEEKGEHLREQSALQLGGLLDPLKVQLKEFREAVTQVHASDQRERGMLSEQIQSLRQLNETISKDAINLTRALKGDSQTRGAWGEMVLERVLEASGLQSGREYHTQASFTGSEGRQRPDAIVHLPESKDIVIDAKVSLVAYERSSCAPDDETRTQAMREHLVAMRRHIEQLGARSYTDIEQLHTLDFVLMFVPVEAAFIEAVRADDSLYTYALERNVSLVSPSTLLATLRTVAHLWRIERRNINAQEIARRGAQLHDNFALLVGELANIGAQLDNAKTAHDRAIRRLVDGGKGSILLQVQSLREMGAPVKKALPRGLLEDAGVSDDDEDSAVASADDPADSQAET